MSLRFASTCIASIAIAASALMAQSPAAARQCTNLILDYPNAQVDEGIQPNGVNDLDFTVGEYFDGGTQSLHGLLWHGTKVVANESFAGTDISYADINNNGDIVGNRTGPHEISGFLIRDGHRTKLQFPGASFTSAFGINNHGVIVGGATMPNLEGIGWVRTNGVWHALRFPGAAATFATAVNDNDVVVGSYTNSLSSGVSRGFTYANGQFVSFGVANESVGPEGINNFNIVGNASFYQFGGFIFRDHQFHHPNMFQNGFYSIRGINNLGDFVGSNFLEQVYLHKCR
ncbi:MAG TPA: hypothetical protein VGC88_08825 [Terriglobales bacterium]